MRLPNDEGSQPRGGGCRRAAIWTAPSHTHPSTETPGVVSGRLQVTPRVDTMPAEHSHDQAEQALEHILGRLYAHLKLDTAAACTLPARPFRIADSLDPGQRATVRLLTTTLAEYFEGQAIDHLDREHRRDRLCDIAAARELTMVAQPIVRLATGQTAGMEALARFPTLDQGPGQVFADAWELGVGLDLELTAVDAAIDLLPAIPDDVYLSVNVAPTTLVSPRFLERVASLPPGRLVAEVTEHAVIDDYDALAAAADRLSNVGVRFAVDDVGAGFSGLERILRLNPEILKIDRSLVCDIDASSTRYAMVAALQVFAEEVGVGLIAEGIETSAELAALCGLGVGCGQGFYLGRPHELG